MSQHRLCPGALASFLCVLALLTTSALPDDRGSRSSNVRPKLPADKQHLAPYYQDPTILLQSANQPGRILATVDFDLIGLAVTASPVAQTVPKNTPTAVLTSLQVPAGTDPVPIITGINPDYRVRGELTGPSLSGPLPLEARIGQPLNIPGLARAGDHVVQNLRVVDTASTGAPVVANVTPDSCAISIIDQLLISEVRVDELSYDDIVRSGITITDDSYQFFNLTLALATSSGVRNLNAPVALPRVGAQDPRPIVGRPSAPFNIGVPVPDIMPIMLEATTAPEDEGLPNKLEFEGRPIRIPGLVVFPGRIGLLNQFFEAIVIVANGAPSNTPLVVRNLRARVVLPDNETPNDPADDPLRIAQTQIGGAVSELEIHGLGPDGQYGTPDDTTQFAPGQSGQASFLLEGLREGLHTPNFRLEGVLEGLPIGPVTVRGEVPGAVLVRDASFAATFTHPAVVRAGQEYDLSLTIYNSGSRDIQGAICRLNRNSISGAELPGSDTGERAFSTTIPRKESSTVVWRLRATTTGAVTASYVKVGQNVESGLALTTGVGDRNVPLSPDSLILPDPVKYLPPDVVEAARALLGQAWSVATAPRGSLPEGVTPITKEVVVNRAGELGQAGLRAAFGEPVQVSLETALRDWLGELQEDPDPGFADAQRDTPSGLGWFDSVGSVLHSLLASGQSPTTPSALHQELVNTESSRSSFISALVTQSAGQPAFGARLVDPQSGRVGFGASTTERHGELPNGASLQLADTNQSSTVGQMLIVSRPVDGNWTLEIAGWQNATADISLVIPTSGRSYRQVVFTGVSLSAGSRHRIVFRPFATTTPSLEEFQGGSYQVTPATPTLNTLSETPPRLVGAIQVSSELIEGGDKYGRLVGLLFSKPMAQAPAQTVWRYQIGGGELIGSNPPVILGGAISVTRSKLDLGGRFVFLALDAPIGPYIRRDVTISGLADARGTALAQTTSLITPRVSPQGRPPGAYVTGRVVTGDGSPVANASVEYRLPVCSSTGDTGSAITVQVADAEGRYVIDYVRNGDCGAPIFIATNTANGARKRISTPVIYDGQHLIVDLVFLARGNVRGAVTLAGAPAGNAFVKVVPALDAAGARVVQADGLGRYQADDLPVGQVSVIGVGAGAQSTATGVAAGSIDAPGTTAVIDVALQNVSGVVRGRVVNPDNSASVGSLVVAWAHLAGVPASGEVAVGFAYTSTDGSFTISRLPLMDIRLEVIDYVTFLRVNATVQLSQTTREINGMVITLPGHGSVSGRVVDETNRFVPNAVVLGGGSQVEADALGYFTLPRLTAGTHTIRATEPLSGMSGSVTVTVRLNETTSGVSIVITRPGIITGQVFMQTGANQPAPVAEALVTHDGIRIAVTDAQGRYTLPSVRANTQFTLRFVHPNRRLAVNYPVFVAPGETVTRNATFRAATLRGRVFQPDGVTGTVAQLRIVVPLPAVQEGQADFGLLGATQPILTQSSADGSYLEANLNPGAYRVTASNTFFPTRVSKGGTLAAGDDRTCDITLVNSLAGKVQGRVFQPDGSTPVGAGVRVTIGGALAEVTVQTDQNGHYEFAEVFAAGNYSLTATDAATGLTNRVSIAVRQNEDAIADIRLLGRGNLRVRVFDGAGAPVQGGNITVEGTAYPRERRFIELTPASGGGVQFDNLTEGAYAINATHNGLSGRVAAQVPLGSSVEATVRLQPAGTVEGRVLMPDGTTPVGLADVDLSINGRTVGVTVSSDSEGQVGAFRFVNVPAGDFTLEAFDNRSGRVGRASGRITSQGQMLSVDIKLIAVGAVTGVVTANGQPVDHALVTIRGGGFATTTLKATTNVDGRFRFTGMPAGRFTLSVTNGPGGLTGFAAGVINGTSEPLPDTVANIALTPSVTVIGTVFDFGGAPSVSGARVTLVVGSRSFETLTNQTGAYQIDWVPLGDINVRAEAPTGYNRGAAATITASTPGETLTADVMLNGTGAVAGNALDSNGSNLSSGTVTFTNDAIGSPVVLTAQVQSDGRYEIRDAPSGEFSIKLTAPNRTAVGAATGVITANQTLGLNLRLEDAGTVSGRVKLSDGTTPANSADVTLAMPRPSGNSIRLYTHTNAQGIYTFENVPLGTASISVSDVASGGIAGASGIALTTNGQTVTAPDLVLDNAAIRVESVTPADGATGVPRNTTIAITFSEPALASSVTTSSVKLLRGATYVPSSLTLSADGRVATLTPSGQLADFASHTVIVTTNVKDLVGHRLEAEFRSSFVTRDETGPVVTAISPANNTAEVPLNAQVQVTFNEALDAGQDLATVITLSPQASGTVSLNETRQVASFTPSTPLVESTRYTVTVTGQRDVYGNVTTATLTSSFTTRDLTAPTIDPLPIDGTRVQTFTPTVTATYRDNLSGINTASVALMLDGSNVTSGATITGTGLSFTPSTPLARGSHTVTVQVSDNAGNASAPRNAGFTVDDTAPVISSFTIGGAPAVNGLTVTSTLRPVFAASYIDDSAVNTSATRLLFGPAGSTPAQVAATVTAANLTFQPSANLDEGLYVAEVIVSDNIGNTATTGQIQFSIDVDAAEITSVNPSRGSQHGATVVVLSGNRLLNSNGTPPIVTINGAATRVTSAVAGSPDQVTIVTPAGAPGPATVSITTDRGTGSLVAGFTYEADPRTPFAVEADTVLLWRLDESGDGAVRVVDAGRLSIDATAGTNSIAQAGRFAGGRTRAAITADDDFDVLAFGPSSFTVECWVKTDPVTSNYNLVSKVSGAGSTNADFALRLLTTGTLRAQLFNTSAVEWRVEVPRSTIAVDDNQWHSIAMVVDRAVDQLKLYVDGIERASAPAPAGFGAMRNMNEVLRAGIRETTGTIEFPGALDEIRVSSTAHSAETIGRTYQGADGQLGLQLHSVTPSILLRGGTTEVIVGGYNLAGASAVVTDFTSAGLPAQVIHTSATQARIQITVGATAALGLGQLTLSSTAGTASITFRIVDSERSVPGPESDTLLLWHLDETANGSVTIRDSGPLSIDGTAGTNSLSLQPGRFGAAARVKAAITADSDYGALGLGASSFTLECWVKTDPVPVTYNLVSKVSGSGSTNTDFALRLLASGTLRGQLFNTSGVEWRVDLPHTIYVIDDNQWHSIVMVVDRAANQLKLYVDGVERASSNAPANFGAMRNLGEVLRAGIRETTGTFEFPGALDEIRISSTAHSAQRISQDFSGDNPLLVTLYGPKAIARNKALQTRQITAVTVNGYNLDGVAARVLRSGQPLDIVAAVDSISYREARVSLAVSQTVSLGPAQLVLSKSGQQDVTLDITITEQTELPIEPDTVLLWRLDETSNGAVTIQDAGPLSIDGVADSDSVALQPGRFGPAARIRAAVEADDDYGSLAFGSSSFTIECWVKTDPVPVTYNLVSKVSAAGSTNTDFALRLLASGSLRGQLFNTSGVEWRVDLPHTVYVVDDNQWHLVAMVVDRTASQLKLYVDGVERASANAPANFGAMRNLGEPLHAGIRETTGTYEFPGALDEVRVSSTALTPERIAAGFIGSDGPRITRVVPGVIQRGSASAPTTFFGHGLAGATAASVASGVTAAVTTSSPTRLDLNVSVSDVAPLGPVQLTVTDPIGQSATAEMTVVDQRPFADSPGSGTGTLVLWHLNEAANGAVAIAGNGDGSPPVGGTGGSNSAPSQGRFDNGRIRAAITGDAASAALGIESSSFTLECWVKTEPAAVNYNLVSKVSGAGSTNTDFALRLLPSGALRAQVFNTAGVEWRVTTPRAAYDSQTAQWLPIIDDNQWHLISMVIDRGAERMTIYVDGVERASAAMPASFGAMRNLNERLRAGIRETTGALEFPGVLDEIRLVNFARTSAQVRDTWFGTTTAATMLPGARTNPVARGPAPPPPPPSRDTGGGQ